MASLNVQVKDIPSPDRHLKTLTACQAQARCMLELCWQPCSRVGGDGPEELSGPRLRVAFGVSGKRLWVPHII